MKEYDPGKITSYCRKEAGLLAAVSVTGVLYNVGMAAGPWFEGQLVQRLVEILGGQKEAAAMAGLAIAYLAVIAFVQFMRFLKRLYVRKFANRTAQAMRRTVYRSVLVGNLSSEDAGSLMTRAISDADDCAEGLRKFITEIFDTGVVIVVYISMLFSYDWRLTLIVLLFPPIAYALANFLKKPVVNAVHAAKSAGDEMRARGLDRVSNAVTYRIYGAEGIQTAEYDKALGRYEQAKIRSGILTNATQPVYYLISSVGFIVIILLGGRNVLGTGWTAWDIAAFSAYFACFGKLAKKSSHAANLFNAVQKAEVSWKRIEPYMHESPLPAEKKAASGELSVSGLTVGFEEGKPLFSDISFSAKPGQIVGITGPVACGKTTLARCFLGEIPYEGSIRIADIALSDLLAAGEDAVSFSGHEPELIDASLADNIALKTELPSDSAASSSTAVSESSADSLSRVLGAADFSAEVEAMPDGVKTVVGSGGGRLSGGQQARLSLARALYHERPVIVLDDPFSAVDAETEGHILNALKTDFPDSIILLISHRLRYFPELDQVLYMENGKAEVGTHEELMQRSPGYRKMYGLQAEGNGETESAASDDSEEPAFQPVRAGEEAGHEE
ncbi:MAG: ABC transporter ATP-binding protein [Lachnospiraceae bacterium]|nr:ABC transporter ATP-binding protein [Lachnospiraceae bacterium]